MNDQPNRAEADRPQGTPVKATVEEAIAIAIDLHKSNRWDQAAYVYRTILAAVPDQVETLNFLGVLLHQAGKTEEGAELIGKAVALCPGYVDAHSNLGNLFRWQGKLPEAAEAYRRAIELEPRHIESHNNLGVILRNQGQISEAEQLLRRAIELDPNRGDAHYNLANVLDQQKRRDEAIVEYRRAIELMPSVVDAYDALGRSLYRKGQVAEALQIYRQLQENVPDSPVAAHMLAALSGDNIPCRASDQYVETTFDRFAEGFDVILKGLDYKAPELVAEAVAEGWPEPQRQFAILDAGCGTGLCGPLLRPYANRLVGIDLSARMLSKAQLREMYDELFQAELTAYLRQQTRCFDLVTSADTLVYFGDLAEVFTAAAGALLPGGRLIFTLEDSDDRRSETGYLLNPHGRYCHHETYVRQALDQAELSECRIRKSQLRTEGGEPVAGLVVSARKA